MAAITVIVTCSVDGHPIAGSPFVAELVVQQYAMVNVQKPQDAAGQYRVIPGTNGAFPIVTSLLLFNTDEPTGYRLQGQTDGNVPLDADGMLLIVGSNMNVGPVNLRANSPDGSGTVLGYVAGRGLPFAIPATLVVDERWEAAYPIPTAPVVDERWEADYPTPATLVVDERWESTGFCVPEILLSEMWETLFCDNVPGAGFDGVVSEQWEVGYCTPFIIFVTEQWEN